MNKESVFENIKHFNEIGQEYWSARELFAALDYIKWDKFLNVIAKAKEASGNSGQEVEHHFPRVEKMIDLPKGAKRDIGDLHLTRYACYQRPPVCNKHCVAIRLYGIKNAEDLQLL